MYLVSTCNDIDGLNTVSVSSHVYVFSFNMQRYWRIKYRFGQQSCVENAHNSGLGQMEPISSTVTTWNEWRV